MSEAVLSAIADMTAALVQSTAAVPVASGYGVDLVCFDDLTTALDETNTETTQSLAQDNYHRLSTPAGSLPDDLDYGKDIAGYLSKGTGLLELLGIEGDVETELRKDDRNAEVSAAVLVRTLLPCVLQLTVSITPANPDLEPFKLIIALAKTGAVLEAIQ